MPSQQKSLITAIKELESDLRLQGVQTCGIVYLEGENPREELRRVSQALFDVGSVINYSQNCVESRYLEGTDYRLEDIKFTGEIMINTSVGKIVLPKQTKYRITSKR
jgi:uncharacterized protein YjeT (DUF2065 family)